jgi:hypothetical protein
MNAKKVKIEINGEAIYISSYEPGLEINIKLSDDLGCEEVYIPINKTLVQEVDLSLPH